MFVLNIDTVYDIIGEFYCCLGTLLLNNFLNANNFCWSRLLLRLPCRFPHKNLKNLKIFIEIVVNLGEFWIIPIHKIVTVQGYIDIDYIKNNVNMKTECVQTIPWSIQNLFVKNRDDFTRGSEVNKKQNTNNNITMIR